MTCIAIIAAKGPSSAKTRLSAALPRTTKRRLVEVMLQRVIAAAADANAISEVVLVTPVAGLQARGCAIVEDRGEGPNGAFACGVRYAASRGHTHAVLLPSDLALVTVADVGAIVDEGGCSGAVIAQDKLGAGTNGLFVPLGIPIEFRFGAQSSVLHADEFRRVGLSVTFIDRVGLAADVDEPEDLELLKGVPGYEFLNSLEWSIA
jgi:2-phospho-L-lactate guanylyltransferase